MTLSEKEIDAIIEMAVGGDKRSVRSQWEVVIRRMLSAVAAFEFRPGRATSLVKLCEAGARYGWQQWEAAHPRLLADLSAKARTKLRRDLQHSLQRVTYPCLKLEQTSFGLAMKAIGVSAGSTNPDLAERMFLGEKPGHRLFSLFSKFPVLAQLWCQVISQWRGQAMEVLSRVRKDRGSIADTLFAGRPLGIITDLRCGLSDSHRGRTVMELQFGADAIIYKPRAGDGEWEWRALMDWMNGKDFKPKLRGARVLRRKGYCWMEWIEGGPLKSRTAAGRFYERIGGLIAAAYLLRAVDCHRDNLVGSGEDPVLVDADALWHVSPEAKTRSPLDLLLGTGFFPNSNPRSLQSRSSILGRANAARYEREIVRGFRKAWCCILGTKDRRATFASRVRRLQLRNRRWIYWPTEKYAAILRASIQPAALRSGKQRDLLIGRLCERSWASSTLIRAEIEALKALDIPYFVRRTKEPMPHGTGSDLAPVLVALRRALRLSFASGSLTT
jgi:lantibiotic modifying enzyme